MATEPKKTTTRKTTTASKPKAAVTKPVVPDTVETRDNSADIDAIMKLIQEQQKTISQLQKQLAEKPVAVTAETTNVYNGPDPNRIVSILCMYDGESLTLKSGHAGEFVTLYGYGDKQYIRYEAAANIARMNRRFAESGAFVFDDSELIKNFGLEGKYKDFIDKKMMDKLGELDSESVVGLYKRTNDKYKSMIVDMFVKNSVDGVSGFNDKNKIEALSEASDKDIQAIADEYKKAKKMAS